MIVFENLRFLMPENAVYVWTKGKNGGKNLRFDKYRDTCFLKQIPSWILAMTCYANHVMK